MEYVADPNNPGWFLKSGADPTVKSAWAQPPDGFLPDPNNYGWFLRSGGDPGDQSNWWQATCRGIDVASYQPTDLTALIAKAEAAHVVIRMYQASVEGASLQAHSRAQVESARANGCSVSTPYLWLYANVDPTQQVNEALDLAQSCGITPTLLFLDIEPYTDGSLPGTSMIQAALDACNARGIRGAIYSGAWVWPRLGNPSFPGVPLWYAVYDGVAALDQQPFGGMVLVGKQFSDKLPSGEAIDLDVFDGSVV